MGLVVLATYMSQSRAGKISLHWCICGVFTYRYLILIDTTQFDSTLACYDTCIDIMIQALREIPIHIAAWDEILTATRGTCLTCCPRYGLEGTGVDVTPKPILGSHVPTSCIITTVARSITSARI